jgi:hypothetical protein
MKRIEFILLNLCICIVLLGSCSNNNEVPIPNPEKCPNIILLQETNWELTGFVNVQTGIIKEPKPNLGRYDLYFHFNKYEKYVTGTSSSNYLEGDYDVNCSKLTIQISHRKQSVVADEIFDGNFYMECLNAVDFFTVSDNELKLYYNKQEDYLLFKRTVDCKIEPLQDILPIDWENYNDVHTVYRNFTTNDCSKTGSTGKMIKVGGWIVQSGANIHKIEPSSFYLTDYPNQILISGSISVTSEIPEVVELLKIKFETNDLTKKCYITGELLIYDFPTNNCCTTGPEIIITNADNIIFE